MSFIHDTVLFSVFFSDGKRVAGLKNLVRVEWRKQGNASSRGPAVAQPRPGVTAARGAH